MRLRAVLPTNRWLAGTLMVEDDSGSVVLGPFPCRGKADGYIAGVHSNPDRDPTRPFGDHPAGLYLISVVQRDKPPAHSYGPFFLLMDPMSGDALTAKENGRTGLAIHGGDLNADGSLRATEGCLRTTNEAISQIGAMEPLGWFYECEDRVGG